MAWTKIGTTTAESYSGSTYYFDVYVEETDISVANNTSNVKVKLEFESGTGSTLGRTRNAGTVTINGTSVSVPKSTSYWRDGTEDSTHAKSWTSSAQSVTHNSDGSKSITISVSMTVGSYGSPNATGSFTATLTQISREGDLTANKSSITTGETVTFTISPYSSSLTYKIDRKVGSKAWETEWKTATAATFTDTYTSIKTQAGKDGNYTVQYRCKTYSGSTQVGSAKTTSITTYFAGDALPMSLYQDGGTWGVSFLAEYTATSNHGFYLAGQGPITPITVTIDGTSVTFLGKQL